MLKQLRFKEKFRCFEEGFTVKFNPGVNLLVGDQGSGKSTLIQAIAAAGNCKKYPFPYGLEKQVEIVADPISAGGFDFEKQNLRTNPHFECKDQLYAMFMSHGQATLGILRNLTKVSNTLVFLDEPDSSLSIKSISKFIKWMNEAVNRGCQIIAAVHHPYVIREYPEVYSLDERNWISSETIVLQSDKILIKELADYFYTGFDGKYHLKEGLPQDLIIRIRQSVK